MIPSESDLYFPTSAKAAVVREQFQSQPAAASALCPTRFALSALAALPDMASSVITFHDRALARLGTAVRSAYPQATGAERLQLERLQILARTGHITVAQAHDLVADLRREHQRTAA